MATTLTLTAYLAVSTTKGKQFTGVTGTVSMLGSNYVIDNQDIGTGAAEPVTAGDVTGGNALVCLKNTDTTNYVSLYTGTEKFSDLLPGQALMLWVNPSVLNAQANTATVRLAKRIFENVDILALVQPSGTYPADGYAREYIRLSGLLEDGTSVGFTWEADAAIVSSAFPTDLAVSADPDAASLNPGGMVGGTKWGFVAALNVNATKSATVGISSDGSDIFADMKPLGGFALWPSNLGVGVEPGYAMAGTGNAHNEAVLITRIA